MALLETLTDTFPGSSFNGTKWPIVGSNATVTGGVAQIQSLVSTAAYNVVQSASTYDATGSYLIGKVVPASGASSHETYLSVDKDDNNWAAMFVSAGVLYRAVKTAGSQNTAAWGTYNSTTHAWWRIRFTTGTANFSYSSDGVSWSTEVTLPVSWAFTAVRTTLMVGKYTSTDATATGTFDNINTPPSPLPTTATAALVALNPGGSTAGMGLGTTLGAGTDGTSPVPGRAGAAVGLGATAGPAEVSPTPGRAALAVNQVTSAGAAITAPHAGGSTAGIGLGATTTAGMDGSAPVAGRVTAGVGVGTTAGPSGTGTVAGRAVLARDLNSTLSGGGDATSPVPGAATADVNTLATAFTTGMVLPDPGAVAAAIDQVTTGKPTPPVPQPGKVVAGLGAATGVTPASSPAPQPGTATAGLALAGTGKPAPPTMLGGKVAASLGEATTTGTAPLGPQAGAVASVVAFKGAGGPAQPQPVAGSATYIVANPLHTLFDAFTGGTVDTTRWPVQAGSIAVASGRAQITIGAGVSTYSVVQSARLYDARNESLIVQVVPATPSGPDNSQQTYISVDTDGSNTVFLWRDQSLMYATVKTAGVETSTALHSFDPAVDVWWRIRFDATTAYFATSPDGFTWPDDTATAITVPWSLAAVRVTLMFGQWSTADPGGVATFDNVNLPPPFSAAVTPDPVQLAVTVGSPRVTFTAQAPTPPPVVVPTPVLPTPRKVGRWSYLLADLLTGAILAEVPLAGANPTKQLGGAGSCSGNIPSSRMVKGDPYRLTTPARTVLYVLYDGEPYWGGIIWTRKFSRSSGVVSIGASDWWSYYDHRKIVQIPDESTDDYLTAHRWTTYTSVDENVVVRNLLALAHSYAHGDIGVVAQNTTSGVTLPLTTYSGYSLTSIGKALADLSQLTNGPDLMFDTVGWTSGGTPQRILRIGTPTLGDPTRPLVLEYGANLLDYTWSTDGTKFTSRMWATGSGQDEGTMMVRADNTTRFTQGWPLLEDSASYTDIFDVASLQALNASNLNAAKLPVVTPSLTVRLTGPGLTELTPGVQVQVVIKDDFFRDGLNTTMRVVAVAPSTDADTIDVTVNPTTEDVV